jgi:hypothetical protein
MNTTTVYNLYLNGNSVDDHSSSLSLDTQICLTREAIDGLQSKLARLERQRDREDTITENEEPITIDKSIITTPVDSRTERQRDREDTFTGIEEEEEEEEYYDEFFDTNLKIKLEAEIEAEMREKMEAKMRDMEQKIADLKTKRPTRKPREPKPIIYWEGQVETDGGYRFDSVETAMAYAETLPKGEALKYVANWAQSFTEKKDKKSTKNRDYDARELPANETATRCSANLWNNGDGCRCRRDGGKTSIDWKGEEVYLCDQHFKNIKENVDKWKLWEEVCGNCPKNGWWDDEEWRSKMRKAEKGGKKADWVAPSRVRKV